MNPSIVKLLSCFVNEIEKPKLVNTDREKKQNKKQSQIKSIVAVLRPTRKITPLAARICVKKQENKECKKLLHV